MVRPALALALTALVLAGCTRTDWHEPPARTETVTASPTTDPTTTRTETATTSSTTDTTTARSGPATIPAPGRLRASTSTAGFVSPSGKIACTLSAGETPFARCDLRSGSLPVPPEVRGECIHDSGTSMVVDGDGARPGCVSDAVQGQSTTEARAAGWWREDFGEGSLGEAVLPYSRALDVGDGVGCESRATGMTCRVGEHGFTINDTAYTTW